MASIVTNRGKARIAGSFNWLTTSVGVLLATASYTPDADHNTVSQVTNELSGGNYARVTTVSGRAITQDDASDRADLVATKVSFTSLNPVAGTPKYAIVYDNTNGTDATRDIIAIIEIASPVAPDGNNYEIR